MGPVVSPHVHAALVQQGHLSKDALEHVHGVQMCRGVHTQNTSSFIRLMLSHYSKAKIKPHRLHFVPSANYILQYKIIASVFQSVITVFKV